MYCVQPLQVHISGHQTSPHHCGGYDVVEGLVLWYVEPYLQVGLWAFTLGYLLQTLLSVLSQRKRLLKDRGIVCNTVN